MSGFADYFAEYILNYAVGYNISATRFLAMFVAAPTSDAGSGGQEMAGTNYARVQIAGTVTASASWTTSSTSITLSASVPSWVVQGMSVYDLTSGQLIGTVGSGSSGSTLNLASAAAHASSGSSDSIQLCAFPAASASSGSEPATAPASVTNSNAQIGFPQAGASGFGGALSASASWTTSSSTITMGVSNPGWVKAGMNVYDLTTLAQVGTVSSYSGTTLTLTGNASTASSGSSDSLLFSGSAVAWGIYDASSSGNLYYWDYLGNNKWVPFTGTSASPCVMTCDSTSDAPANGSSIVVTQKYGGTLPATSGSWAGLLTTNNLSGATFTAGVNSTGIGGGLFRQVTTQPIAQSVTASFSTSTFTLSAA